MRLYDHRTVACGAQFGRIRGLGSFACELNGPGQHGAVRCHRMVSAVTVASAGLAFFLDIADFPAGRDLAVAAHDAAAGESGEAEKSDETHDVGTLFWG